MRKQILATLAALPMMVMGQYKSQVWSPDNGDGTYTNPVINADYSDPDVCVGASGEDYYMTASSFQCSPGLPILHSKDLVNWEIINYAIGSLYEGDEQLQQAPARQWCMGTQYPLSSRVVLHLLGRS